MKFCAVYSSKILLETYPFSKGFDYNCYIISYLQNKNQLKIKAGYNKKIDALH